MTAPASVGYAPRRVRLRIADPLRRRAACIERRRCSGQQPAAVSTGESGSARIGTSGVLGMGARLLHDPVLYHEVLELLRVRPGRVYVDCTTGLGGHSEGILERLQGSGRLIALDRDSESLQRARTRLEAQFENFSAHHENFENLPSILATLEIQSIDGCLLDLGMSSFQLDSGERGFSFQQEGPLDMRMDRDQVLTAEQLVNELPEERLADILWRYGEEKAARKLAAAIVAQRRRAKLRTTTELAGLVERVKGRPRGSRLHPATQVFQALRIAVNQELSGLEQFLTEVVQILKPGGCLVVIAFHSLEDRIVKQTFQREAGKCICRRRPELCDCPRLEQVLILTKKPVTPSASEVQRNPRARSAKLRAVQKPAVGLSPKED
jgi:16S rRNA (cytosine1402-N4)-methyltransferase